MEEFGLGASWFWALGLRSLGCPGPSNYPLFYSNSNEGQLEGLGCCGLMKKPEDLCRILLKLGRDGDRFHPCRCLLPPSGAPAKGVVIKTPYEGTV